MKKNNFTAWSLYTGPSNLKPVIPDQNCPWVFGEWSGININTSSKGIKKDIDKRIELLIETFKYAYFNDKNKNLNDESEDRHFIIPEFFFRCKQGPYPNVKVDNQHYPLEYIRTRIKDELLKFIKPTDKHSYTVVIGSIMTSNIVDYKIFLNSSAVKQRLKDLNIVMRNFNMILKSNSSLSGKAIHKSWLRNSTLSQKEKNSNGLNVSNDLDALNDFMKECRANPLCTVRNRGIYFYCKPIKGKVEVETFIYEKQFESTVDLTMGIFDEEQKKVNHGNMITEWMANYPSYSIIKGDKHTDEHSTNSRFTLNDNKSNDVGVEICLDHRLQRLRRTVEMSKKHGADRDNYPIFKQLIPSGGMQILDYSVAANKNSVIFNADGCDKVYGTYGDENTEIPTDELGKFTGITCGVYNHTIQSKWEDKDNIYYSHSQLAFTTDGSDIAGFNNALGNKNKKASTFNGSEKNPSNPLLDQYISHIIKMRDSTELFAVNNGDLHVYRH